MKSAKIVLTVLLAFVLCSAFSLKKQKKDVYAFGLSASFTDTVVYYTEIQLLDSIQLDKSDFLPHRDLYSYQLKNYLEYQKGQKNRTCMIYFSENKKKLEKEQVKVLNKYKKNKNVVIQQINKTDFLFKKPAE